jgi:uncharacterized membrane protein
VLVLVTVSLKSSQSNREVDNIVVDKIKVKISTYRNKVYVFIYTLLLYSLSTVCLQFVLFCLVLSSFIIALFAGLTKIAIFVGVKVIGTGRVNFLINFFHIQLN